MPAPAFTIRVPTPANPAASEAAMTDTAKKTIGEIAAMDENAVLAAADVLWSKKDYSLAFRLLIHSLELNPGRETTRDRVIDLTFSMMKANPKARTVAQVEEFLAMVDTGLDLHPHRAGWRALRGFTLAMVAADSGNIEYALAAIREAALVADTPDAIEERDRNAARLACFEVFGLLGTRHSRTEFLPEAVRHAAAAPKEVFGRDHWMLYAVVLSALARQFPEANHRHADAAKAYVVAAARLDPRDRAAHYVAALSALCDLEKPTAEDGDHARWLQRQLRTLPKLDDRAIRALKPRLKQFEARVREASAGEGGSG